MNPTKTMAAASRWLIALSLALGAAAARAEEAPASTASADRYAREEAIGQQPEGQAQATVLSIPIHFSGNFWVDTGYMSRTNAQPGQYNQAANYMGGRFVLGADYKREFEGFFAKAKVELVGFESEYAGSRYEPHTQDAYVMFGGKRWDVQVGRFLAWEVYHRGQGIELYTAEEAGALGAPSLYWLDFTRGHKNEAGQAAVHFYPLDFLAVELAGVYGQESNQNNLGIRPVVSLKQWGAELIAGYEFLKQAPQTDADKTQTTSQGTSARLQYKRSFVSAGAEFAWATIESIGIDGLIDSGKSLDKITFGGFANLDFGRHSIGLGYHRTNQTNQRTEHITHDQGFVSYLVELPIKGLTAKAVYGIARGHVTDKEANFVPWDNWMQSVRVRLRYDFQ